MSAKQPSELLYDFEATLRLVDSAIRDMGELGSDASLSLEQTSRAAAHHDRLTTTEREAAPALQDARMRGYAEILAVLASLRQSRNLLQRAAADRTQYTNDQLRQWPEAAAPPATDVLKHLGEANTMVETLDAYADSHGEPDGRALEIRAALRAKLFALMRHQQLQDSTRQQLVYASAVLTELEARLSHVVGGLQSMTLSDSPSESVAHPVDGANAEF